MPAKGKHRRPRSNSITRGFVAAGTGGAALALPLIAATGANAAEKAAPAAASSPVTQKAAEKVTKKATQAAAKKTGTKTYSVVSGDYLSKIADRENVRGGWQKLYADNREVVGGNPSLILPGMKLTIGAKAPAEAPAAPQAKAEAKPEVKPQAEAAAKQETSTVTGSGFSAPVPAGVTTPYRAAGGSWSSGYHTGVDFSASSGTPVKAVSSGTVVSAGWGGAYGNEVVIKHDDGRYSQYAHLSSLAVSSGQSVSGGTQIGLSGSTGNSTGPHLHFEIRTGPGYGSDVDPLAYLRGNGVSI
ncbi:peptidoglycan DD-metalloendopeptidase family protein [Streptomyces sp. ISL-98]|uniref:M23 family metallopeptidase n=1 Tax=Streptomyces sp. ISL-98 TaxID=2819192 RepID=UPI001BEA6BF7|nr:LysM peptidoglycan-binding domain-containing M23 family metallopeptidase [Streptomyces sp. ISL-98]MBT2507989.1 peptidoglycan DD-metalloendopeptidase family protein [Streptomyces sp. ISL-98]